MSASLGGTFEGDGTTLPRHLRELASDIEHFQSLAEDGHSLSLTPEQAAYFGLRCGTLAAALSSMRHTCDKMLRQVGFVREGAPTYEATTTGAIEIKKKDTP